MLEQEIGSRIELSEMAVESVRLVASELEKIESNDIRRFTLSALLETDPRFWVAAASSTGKYHPPEDNGEGGLVRHVVKGVAVIEQFARRARFTQYETDMAISAFLLHDTCKNGVVWGENTDFTHGLIAAIWLEQFELADKTAKMEIINAVRFHMAPWCYAVSPFENRWFSKEEMVANLDELSRAMYPSRVEEAVREADYWSSRQVMSFMPGVAVDWRHDAPGE